MEQNFAEQFDQLETEVSVEKTKGKKPVDQAMAKEIMEDLREAIAADPTLKGRLCARSKDIAVSNTLGFGDKGNILLDKEKSTSDKREVVGTSKIVGYVLNNVSASPINYKTEKFTEQNGVWVGTEVEMTAEPGATFELSRKYVTILGAEPEFSFEFANGRIVKGSGCKSLIASTAEELEEILTGHHFIFSDKTLKVNDDAIKLQVGKKKKIGGEETWVVAPKYEETFGFLNNKKENKGRTKKTAEGVKASAAAAHYIKKLVESQGAM